MAEVRSFLIGLLLFSAIVVGMSQFYTALITPEYLEAYGLTAAQIANISPEDLSSYNVTSELTNRTEAIEEALRQTPTGITAVDVAWGYINAAMSAVTLPLEAIAYFENVITTASHLIGLPDWVFGIIITIITVIIVFEVLSAYMKWRI